jgi:hypothetical protein
MNKINYTSIKSDTTIQYLIVSDLVLVQFILLMDFIHNGISSSKIILHVIYDL